MDVYIMLARKTMNSFYALQPRWFSFDRYYKIYVTDYWLCGVVLAKQIYDDDSARNQMIRPAQIFAPLMWMWAEWLMRQLKSKEAEYDSENFQSDNFLYRDKGNFRIARADIVSVVADPKKRLWTGYNRIAGTLQVSLRDRSLRKFIITGDQHLDAILDGLGSMRQQFVGTNGHKCPSLHSDVREQTG